MNAKERKEHGQQLAAQKAGVSWQQSALHMLRRYIETLKGSKCGGMRLENGAIAFTFDAFRAWTEEPLHGLSFRKPRSLNAWGSLPVAAMREGIIEGTDLYSIAKRPASHGRVLRVWKAL